MIKTETEGASFFPDRCLSPSNPPRSPRHSKQTRNRSRARHADSCLIGLRHCNAICRPRRNSFHSQEEVGSVELPIGRLLLHFVLPSNGKKTEPGCASRPSLARRRCPSVGRYLRLVSEREEECRTTSERCTTTTISHRRRNELCLGTPSDKRTSACVVLVVLLGIRPPIRAPIRLDLLVNRIESCTTRFFFYLSLVSTNEVATSSSGCFTLVDARHAGGSVGERGQMGGRVQKYTSDAMGPIDRELRSENV